MKPKPRGVLYARVSSKDQEREGFSIDAQLKLLRAYAEANEIRVVEEFIDIETAKAAGRTNFNQMIAYVRRHPTIDTILVEKTDRLYRNLRDWVTLDEFEIDVHLVKEGVVLSPDSKSSEKFMHGIKVLMAKNYIDNLSEEARKGMIEKAEQGIWPTVAPLGYRNIVGPLGKKIIEVDPYTAPGVTRLFEWYGTGRYSLKEAGKKAREMGMAYRKSGKPLGVSSVHRLLRSRIYTGEFEWLGQRYQGSHQPLVSMDLWEKVQDIMDGRHQPRAQEEKNFIFSGLINCGHCGGKLVGDIKKQKYIYYRCSRYKGNCKEPYVRQERLLDRFVDIVAQVSMTPEMFKWLGQALKENSDLVASEHAKVLDRLRRDQDDIRERMKQAYVDHIDGRIDEDIFTRITADFRQDQKSLAREFDRLSIADDTYIEDGIALLGIARDARKMFADADFAGKRNILNHVLSNCSYKGEQLQVTFRKPFDIIVESLPRAELAADRGSAETPKSEKWLPSQYTSKIIMRIFSDETRKTISKYRAIIRTSKVKPFDDSVDFVSDSPLSSIRGVANGMRKRDRDRAEPIRLSGGPKLTLRERAVAFVRERGEVRTKDLTDIGVHRCYLAPMCKEGLLEKIGHGRYRAPPPKVA